MYPLSLENGQMFLSFGIKYDNSLNYDIPIGLFAPESSSALVTPVNNVKIIFTINQTTI